VDKAANKASNQPSICAKDCSGYTGEGSLSASVDARRNIRRGELPVRPKHFPFIVRKIID
jgi:hypothetical protein